MSEWIDQHLGPYIVWLKAFGAVLLTFCMAWLMLLIGGAIYLWVNRFSPMDATIWTWLDCYVAYPDDHKRLWLTLCLSFIITIVVPGIVVILSFSSRRELHGSARFANDGEVRQAGLFNAGGIVVGKHKGQLLRFPKQQFVLLAAPTRSGKGVGIVIPNCLSYEDSLVVLDIKQENYDITAGYRRDVLKQEVYLFNPFAEDVDGEGRPAPRTHRYNPLSSISQGVFRVGDILSIGNAIWPSGGKDAFWNDNARNLFLAIVLFLCELRDRRESSDPTLPNYPVSMGEVLRQSSGRGSGQPVKKYLSGLMADYDWLSAECCDAMSNFLSASDDVLASILSTFNAPLTIWRNPIVDAATSCNDFDLRDVRKKRMSIYIGITPDHLADARLLVNLLFSQLVNLNTKQLPQANHDGPNGDSVLKYSCLLLMDEFTSIGKVDIIAKAVSYIAGYNLRLLPIIQSVAQLESVYGKEDARTFITNHALQIIYAPREQKDANEYSEMLGYLTEKSASISRPRGWFSAGGLLSGKSRTSESVSDQKRALMLPQELKELGLWRQIILLENVKPIICDKIRYYADPAFKTRLLKPPEVKAMDIDAFIAKTQQRLRDLSDGDIDFEQGCIRNPPNTPEMLELYETAPPPPKDDDEESISEYVEACFRAIGVSQADMDRANAFKRFEDAAQNFPLEPMEDEGDAIQRSDEELEAEADAAFASLAS